MVLIAPKQIREAGAPIRLQDATVSVTGYFYSVDLGPETRSRYHQVGKDRKCTCGLGAECPAVKAVAGYLRSGGERAPDVPDGFYPVVPRSCPECGASTYHVPTLSSKRRGAGWACERGGEAHYWLAHSHYLRKRLAENPWIFQPVLAPDGAVLYPGLKRDEIVVRSRPWPDGYDPDR